MRTFLIVTAASLVACSTAVGPEDGRPATQGDPAIFAYDRSGSADLRILDTETVGAATIHRITYNSPKGGLVTGLLGVPVGAGQFAGMIAQHGLPGVASQMRGDIIAFANAGAVVIAIDAPFNRRTGPVMTMTPQDSVEQVQLITDLQRAVDILRARDDVDDARIGYFGYSYGAAMGSLLAGVERRISTFVLSVGDGGLVAHMTGPDDPDWSMREPGFDRWRAAMDPIEPIHYVGGAAPAKLYFQSARLDELVPPEDAVRLHEAASQPKQVQWYETGHNLGPVARQHRHEWFVQHLGIRPM